LTVAIDMICYKDSGSSFYWYKYFQRKIVITFIFIESYKKWHN